MSKKEITLSLYGAASCTIQIPDGGSLQVNIPPEMSYRLFISRNLVSTRVLLSNVDSKWMFNHVHQSCFHLESSRSLYTILPCGRKKTSFFRRCLQLPFFFQSLSLFDASSKRKTIYRRSQSPYTGRQRERQWNALWNYYVRNKYIYNIQKNKMKVKCFSYWLMLVNLLERLSLFHWVILMLYRLLIWLVMLFIKHFILK